MVVVVMVVQAVTVVVVVVVMVVAVVVIIPIIIIHKMRSHKSKDPEKYTVIRKCMTVTSHTLITKIRLIVTFIK